MLVRELAESREWKVSNPSDLEATLQSDEFRIDYVPTALDRIELSDDGTMSVDGRQCGYVQPVIEQLARAIGMPLNYAYDLPFELFNTNFEELKRARSAGMTLCVARDDTVVGIAPAGYTPARTLDVLEQLSLDAEILQCRKAVVSDFGIDVNLIIPSVTIEPSQGDVIHIGIRVTNSETGGKALQGSLFTERLVCLNGATFRKQDSVAYWTKHKKRTYGSSLKSFIADLSGLQQRAKQLVHDVYRDVMDRPVYDDQFVNLFRNLHRRLRRTDAVDAALGVEPEERIELQRRVRDRDRGEHPETTHFRLFDLHNRLTAAARDERFLRRQDLEELGGRLLFSRN